MMLNKNEKETYDEFLRRAEQATTHTHNPTTFQDITIREANGYNAMSTVSTEKHKKRVSSASNTQEPNSESVVANLMRSGNLLIERLQQQKTHYERQISQLQTRLAQYQSSMSPCCGASNINGQNNELEAYLLSSSSFSPHRVPTPLTEISHQPSTLSQYVGGPFQTHQGCGSCINGGISNTSIMKSYENSH